MYTYFVDSHQSSLGHVETIDASVARCLSLTGTCLSITGSERMMQSSVKRLFVIKYEHKKDFCSGTLLPRLLMFLV